MPGSARLTHLERLEAESIHILREVVAEAEKPVMLYSVGKDSAVMLHLARKAFHPAPPPFPLLHVDTTWKFKAMYELRDRMAARFREDAFVPGLTEAISAVGAHLAAAYPLEEHDRNELPDALSWEEKDPPH